MEVLRNLGEYANNRFKPIGGFSARHSRDEVLTIFPHSSPDEVHRMIEEFAQELKVKALSSIENIAAANADKNPGSDNCFDIFIRAGVTEVYHVDDIEQIINKARAKQEIIVTYRCNPGGIDL